MKLYAMYVDVKVIRHEIAEVKSIYLDPHSPGIRTAVSGVKIIKCVFFAVTQCLSKPDPKLRHDLSRIIGTRKVVDKSLALQADIEILMSLAGPRLQVQNNPVPPPPHHLSTGWSNIH
jgi:hypothetical protein